jgi:hypothetical protein
MTYDKKKSTSGGSDAPLSIYEVLKRDNLPAKQNPPLETVERLASRKIVLSGASETEIQKRISTSVKNEDVDLVLPASVRIG